MNATGVTVPAGPESSRASAPVVYAVDVRTGRSREVFAVREDGLNVVPGLGR
ncbi:hypothetical protein [Nonomuraea sp. NPDC049607]|uniref:hypothetical protein n=1 Tax=Nonomuraea sp. NPDC049607 TaxID=3154732 RepID=UPI003420CFE0